MAEDSIVESNHPRKRKRKTDIYNLRHYLFRSTGILRPRLAFSFARWYMK